MKAHTALVCVCVTNEYIYTYLREGYDPVPARLVKASSPAAEDSPVT